MIYEVAIEIAPIEEDGVHIFVAGRIAGRKARFLIDTGASRSVVDKTRITRFFPGQGLILTKLEKLSTGLGTNSMESNMILLPLMSLGRVILRDYRMAVLDLSHINASYRMLGLKEIDGVIGGDLLRDLNALIDYQGRELRLSRNS